MRRSLLVVPALLAACGSVDPETLYGQGELDVGYVVTSTTYTPPGAEAREVPVHVWYPAAPGSEALAAEYAVAGIVAVPSEVAKDAAQPLDDGPYPVVVYSHGSGGEGLLAYPYAEHLASRGFLVIAADHLGNTARDYLNNTAEPFLRNVVNRPLDVTAALDVVPELDAEGDLDHVLVFGHSFGGYTTYAVGGVPLDTSRWQTQCADPNVEDDGSCEEFNKAEVQAALAAGFRDERVDAIVPQAPALVPDFAEGGLAALDIPTMQQSGRMDQTTTQDAQAAPAWAGLDHPDDVWVELPAGGHYSFITICDDLSATLLNAFRPDAPEDGCGEDFTPVSEAIPVLNAYLEAFTRRHLLNEKGWDDVIAGEPLADFVEITTRSTP